MPDVPGDDHDWALLRPGILFQGPHCFQSAQRRKAQIEHDEIRMHGERFLQTFTPICGQADLVTLHAQMLGVHFPIIAGIVHD